MANQLSTTEQPKTPVKKVYKRRVSAKVRKALTLRVEQGLTWSKAAEQAGLSEAGIHKARKASHVVEELERLKGQYIAEVEQLAGPHKARALEVARDLLENSKSDQVKARMVEFLRPEPKNTGVSVAIQVNNNGANGYEYVRPGASIVEINQSPDTTSSDESTEALTNKA